MRRLLLITFVSLLAISGLAAPLDKVKITSIKAGNNVYMLQGAGGNIGVFVSSKGLVLIDDQFAPLAEKIEVAMKNISSKPLVYIINTHFHGDHTGSNSHFSEHAPIIAHKNVRERLSQKPKQKRVELPVMTYQNGLTIYLDDEEIQLTHYAKAHTDGDTVVYFKKANVLHTGDLFFEIGFPYIDLKHGGSVNGYLGAVKKLIAKYPDDVVIISGHGKMSDKKGMQDFAKMIESSIAKVKLWLAAGKTTDEILKIGLGKDFKKYSWAFINEEKWLKTLIQDLNQN
ncbi:MAG: MBL fold metallo-hydrolase [Enterobacterales bacterium]|nr:MBL fold metallo-hydrolase [Enterobacterales bacterium]